jgi:glycosyltransferase involved in cell wall biosynthesis
MTMARLLVISEKYWPDGGGAQLATHLVLSLLRGNYETTVLTGTRAPKRLGGARYLYSELLDVSNKIALWKNLASMSRLHPLLKLIEESDVVYVPGIAYPLIPVARKLGKRVVVHLHDFQPISYSSVILDGGEKAEGPNTLGDIANTLRFEISEGRPVPRALLASALSPINRFSASLVMQSSVVICVSQRQAEIVRRRIPGIGAKTRVIYNPPPPLAAPVRGHRERNFLFFGGASSTKGLGVFMAASRRIEAPKSVGFTIAGVSKGAMGRVVRMCDPSRQAYEILGKLPYDEAVRLYPLSLACVIPSLCHETFSYVVLESMLSETIPIASRVGGIPEIVSGSPAETFLFRAGDVGELTDRMNSVASMDGQELTSIGIGLRRQALERFSESQLKQEYLKAFGEEMTVAQRSSTSQ